MGVYYFLRQEHCNITEQFLFSRGRAFLAIKPLIQRCEGTGKGEGRPGGHRDVLGEGKGNQREEKGPCGQAEKHNFYLEDECGVDGETEREIFTQSVT